MRLLKMAFVAIILCSCGKEINNNAILPTYNYRITQFCGGTGTTLWTDQYLTDNFHKHGNVIYFITHDEHHIYLMGNIRIEKGEWTEKDL